MHRARRPPGLPRAARAPPLPPQTLSPRFRRGRAASGERGARPTAPHRAGLPPGDGGAARILPAQAVGKGREGGREEGMRWEMHMVAPRLREGRGWPGRGGRAGLGRAGPARRRRPAKLRAVGKAGAPHPFRPSRVPGPTRSSGMKGVVPRVAALVRRKLPRLDLAERQDRKPESGGREWERCGKASSITSVPGRWSRIGILPATDGPRCESRRLRWALAGVTRRLGQALCRRAAGAESSSEPPSAAAAPGARGDPRPAPGPMGMDGCSLLQCCVDERAKCLREVCD